MSNYNQSNFYTNFFHISWTTFYIYNSISFSVNDTIKINRNHPFQPRYKILYITRSIRCTREIYVETLISQGKRKKEQRREQKARVVVALSYSRRRNHPVSTQQRPPKHRPPPWMTPSLPQKFPDPLHRRVPFLLPPLLGHGFAADSVSLDPNSIGRGRRGILLSLSPPRLRIFVLNDRWARRNNKQERHNKAVSRLSALSDPRWWTR